MENKIALLDSSILIDHFRRKDKENSALIRLTYDFDKFCISSITEFEIYVGAPQQQKEYWRNILLKIDTLPFDNKAAHAAVTILNSLKEKRKTIDKADLFIAAVAVSNSLPFATLNFKHFDQIDNLELIH